MDYSKRHQEKYKNSLFVVNHLCDNGIDYIGEIIQTVRGELFAYFDAAVLGVFKWIDGENIETDDTKIPEYRMLGKIYPLTKQGFNIPSTEFSDDTAKNFYNKWRALENMPPSEEGAAVLDLFDKNRMILERRASRLNYFSSLCRHDFSNFYFTHGDAGSNLLVNNGRYHMIDWDEVMYAPPERDAWVMCCRGWALKAFCEALKQNGINYTLREERLAFYCYHMFFLYMNELLDDFSRSRKRKDIEDLFTGWIEERIQYADSL